MVEVYRLPVAKLSCGKVVVGLEAVAKAKNLVPIQLYTYTVGAFVHVGSNIVRSYYVVLKIDVESLVGLQVYFLRVGLEGTLLHIYSILALRQHQYLCHAVGNSSLVGSSVVGRKDAYRGSVG